MKTRAARVAGMAALALTAAAPASDIVLEWNQQVLKTIRQNGDFETASPGATSRYSAMMFVAMYDAVNSVTRSHEPYLGFFDCPPETSIEAAAATAACVSLGTLFNVGVDMVQINGLYVAQMASIPDGPGKEAGVALGTTVAKAILAARENDGSVNYVEYPYTGEPGTWMPTFPDFTGAWGAHWCFVDPWCMTSTTQFRPSTGPYGYTDMPSLLASPEYAADFEDVRLNGGIFSKTRTEDESLAALYWANDRNGTFKPPGHLLHITEVIAADRKNSLEENARLFALVSLGMADAGVASWDLKYAAGFNLWRPITAIWMADTDGNPATIADPAWLGYSYHPSVLVFNPPFPAWVSGHATFGAVHAAVVRNYYGTDRITFTATSDDTPGYWRTFHSLDDAARENGRSRIWLGVHFQMDNEGGYELGTAIGDYISANFLRRLGDLNGDGVIDTVDITMLLGAWGEHDGPEDLNGDGTVDAADLTILLGNWG